jgi:hypothetical protein
MQKTYGLQKTRQYTSSSIIISAKIYKSRAVEEQKISYRSFL